MLPQPTSCQNGVDRWKAARLPNRILLANCRRTVLEESFVHRVLHMLSVLAQRTLRSRPRPPRRIVASLCFSDDGGRAADQRQIPCGNLYVCQLCRSTSTGPTAGPVETMLPYSPPSLFVKTRRIPPPVNHLVVLRSCSSISLASSARSPLGITTPAAQRRVRFRTWTFSRWANYVSVAWL